jgi:hypothetical protein
VIRYSDVEILEALKKAFPEASTSKLIEEQQLLVNGGFGTYPHDRYMLLTVDAGWLRWDAIQFLYHLQNSALQSDLRSMP